MTSEPLSIEAHGLTKTFGTKKGVVRALDGLDIEARAGQVTAILGPNGASKSTFVRAVATLLRPDSGRLVVAGVDAARQPEQVRRAIGLAGQYAAVEPAMTGRENLEMVATLFGHSRASSRAAATAVLAQLGLADAGDRLVRGYSGGMRRRLDLGASLVGRPKVLLLDEPTRRITVAVDLGTDRLAEAVRVLAERQLPIDDIGLRRPTLDEVFLTLTGNPAAAA